MEDGSTTVDDIAIAAAARIKESTGGENQEKKVDPVLPGDSKGGPDPVPPVKTDPPAPNPVNDLLKELGFDTIDGLKESLKPKEPAKPETPEEKEKRETLEKANLIKYAAEKGVMKPEDFTTMENLKAKADTDLVYENWLTGWKEDNKDVLPEDADARAKEDFEAEYKASTKRGLAKIEKEAKELRSPLENKYNAVKQNFDGVRELEKVYPDFEKKVSAAVKEFIPEKFEVFKVTQKTGDKETDIEEVPIEVELSAKERVDIFQKVAQDILKDENNFNLFKKGDFKAIQSLAKDRAETMIRDLKKNEGAQLIAQEFLSRGKKSAPSVGAKEPFALSKDPKQPADEGSKTDKQKVLESLQSGGRK